MKIFFIVFAISLMFLACQNSLLPEIEEFSKENKERKTTIVDSKKVVLLEGVSIEYLGKSLDEKTNIITDALASVLGRSINDVCETFFSTEDIESILKTTIDSVTIPNLLEPTNKDLQLIKKDFPELTEKEIKENWEEISNIYYDQLSALSLENVLNEITNNSTRYISAHSIYETIPLTRYELGAILMHPINALSLSKQRQLTKQYMGSQNTINEKTDAFRHAILNIVMAKEGKGTKTQKINWANDFTTAHERGAKYLEKESEMDLHNNAVGRDYYNQNTEKIYGKFLWWTIEKGVKEPSYEKACIDIKSKAVNGIFIDRNLLLNQFNTISNINKLNLIYIIPDSKIY